MKVVIPGGSGQIGTMLARAFVADGHEVVVVSRQSVTKAWRVMAWEALVAECDGADVVLNLAGRSVNCRYGEANRREIVDSRVRSTHAVAEAIACAARPPRVWLQMSTATIYAHRYDAPNDEGGIIGGDEADVPETWRFSIGVAKAWEQAAMAVELPNTRRVLLRAVNLAAPNPLPNDDFMRALREAWGTRIGLPAAKWMLEVGAIFLRTETELILKSRRVIPGRLMRHGFAFDFPAWPEAARDLCRRWREERR